MAQPSKPRVLVVEDQIGPREALAAILGSQYDLRLAPDGRTAIDIIRDEPIHIVIQDIGLPDYYGLDLLREIKTIRRDVPVIIVSGEGTFLTAETAMKYGAAAYLLKPFQVKDVLDLVGDVLAALPLSSPQA